MRHQFESDVIEWVTADPSTLIRVVSPINSQIQATWLMDVHSCITEVRHCTSPSDLRLLPKRAMAKLRLHGAGAVCHLAHRVVMVLSEIIVRA